MANWVIERDRGGAAVYYHNLSTDVRHPLGRVGAEYSDGDIVDWIFKYGDPATGDRVTLSDGKSLLYMAAEAAEG